MSGLGSVSLYDGQPGTLVPCKLHSEFAELTSGVRCTFAARSYHYSMRRCQALLSCLMVFHWCPVERKSQNARWIGVTGRTVSGRVVKMRVWVKLWRMVWYLYISRTFMAFCHWPLRIRIIRLKAHRCLFCVGVLFDVLWGVSAPLHMYYYYKRIKLVVIGN